jgi:uncharacterized membrane protein
MNSLDITGIIFRWLHIVGAIIAAGGTIFAAVVLLPAMREVPEEARPRFHEAVRRKYAMVFHFAMTLLILSGIWNLIPKWREHQDQQAYKTLMGVKILLAMVIFFFGIALTGRSAALEPIRQKRKRFLMLNIFLALIVVAIGAILRFMPASHP